jgi:hypothetical protein
LRRVTQSGPPHPIAEEREMTTTIPPGNVRVRVLKTVLEYARESFQPGAVLVVDEGTAQRWLKAKLAEAAPAPEVAQTSTWCPRCGSPMTYPETPEPSERWTQCRNSRCGFGWMR